MENRLFRVRANGQGKVRDIVREFYSGPEVREYYLRLFWFKLLIAQ